MELLLALGIPAVLLIAATLLLANGNRETREKLFRFKMSGKSAQAWTFGIILISTLSLIVYFSKN